MGKIHSLIKKQSIYRVNPKIVKDISNIIKPYWELINKSSDYYKLRTLAIDVGKINIKVKEDVERLLEAFKDALKYLPKYGKTTFAYKIDDVNKLQLNLMAVG